MIADSIPFIEIINNTYLSIDEQMKERLYPIVNNCGITDEQLKKTLLNVDLG